MLDTTKRTLATLTAATFLGAGGWAIAQTGATTTPNTQGQGANTQPGYGRGWGDHRRAMADPVTAEVLAKITSAVQAKLPGSTVERAMKAPDGTYHAHVVQKDGTAVHVALNGAFAVTSVDQGMRGGHGRGRGPMGAQLSAADLAKVKAGVLAKLPGATVERAMKAPDGTYHAHVVRKDGTQVHVALDAAFKVTRVDTRMGPGPGPGMHGRGMHDGHGRETVLTGDVAAKVKAAALAKLPGATVDRLENDADGGTYEAHVTKADGSHATVKVDASFNVTSVENR